MEIQDLVTLTRALFHLGDRIAWLSVLRAPYCGLTLSDLFAVTQHCQDAPLWKSLVNFHEIKPLSEDGNIRLQRVIPIFAEALAQQGRRPLAQWIKETWAALGGPACLTQATALLNTKTFFNLLEGIEYEFNFTLLENKLNRLYAQSDPNQGKNLHIMTIHKTKGLEFDHVILPGLNQKTAADKARILRWLERPSLFGSNDLILAPIQAAKDQWDPIYSYLKNIENTKLHYEAARLLYVAITRAKMSCHFICSISNENDSTELKLPNKGSFLDLLWPISHNEIVNQAISFPTKNNEIIKRNLSAFVRLKSDWQSPWHALHTHETLVDYTHLTKNIQFHQSLGTVIHEALEMIAHHGIEHWDNNHDRRAYWRRRLQQFGVLPDYLETHTNLVMLAIHNTLNDPQGRWILSQTHQEARNEYAITVLMEDQPIHYIIDRTFIHEGVRWIIDYKAALPTNQPLPMFIEQQQYLYSEQLHHYAHAFLRIENRPVKLGLYFPLCSAWCECAFSQEGAMTAS